MTKGFVTFATGDIKYFKIAQNMLHSFKLHNPNSKFAIICDKENRYTTEFDDVIILENSCGNYLDKFNLLIKAPYDETIFIEPDCLIYRDISYFWDLLSKESDFTGFGWNKGGVDCWFKTPEVKKHLLSIVSGLQNIDRVPLFAPGFMFIRKGAKCTQMYNDCVSVSEKILKDDILSRYEPIFCNGKLRDDPIFNIAMHMSGFVCAAVPNQGKCVSLPTNHKIDKIEAVAGKLDVTNKQGEKLKDCALLHFSTRRTQDEGLYLWQVILFNLARKGNPLYKILDNSLFYGFCCFFRFTKTRFRWLIESMRLK